MPVHELALCTYPYVLIGLRHGETHCVQWNISSNLQHRGTWNWRSLFMVNLTLRVKYTEYLIVAAWHGRTWWIYISNQHTICPGSNVSLLTYMDICQCMWDFHLCLCVTLRTSFNGSQFFLRTLCAYKFVEAVPCA